MSRDQGKFYLGRIFDREQGKDTDQPVLYNPADLTTHAVVVGMTGSGKTGLCIDLLEEAALGGIPALMVDPKGDITNVLLHFPSLTPQDFLPWINVDQARREGQTPGEAASAAADMWRKGLGEWGIGPDRITALRDAVRFAVYTPGSEAGIAVNILGSLKAPEIPWEENRELLRERISSTVTALLTLVGMQDVDPVSSREHILIANIFEQAWSNGRDLDLADLILQIQTPSFIKLGVFDVNTFFPEKERLALAMRLNNILASPAFQAWTAGEPLDIPRLLYDPSGRPRHSVFYIAHLSDAERMFFVTLLFSAFETWMRSQSGSTTLRALIYFDEIFGYMPPIANPPSKLPMLRMLKQARAFGMGLVLATQNPVDVDYKGLSNTGTWFVGKLQTDQDKQRLLDGLEGAAGGFDRSEYDLLISSLGKRVFLLHNVNQKKPLLFRTRWAMNYLTGPLTRIQIPAVNQLVGASASVQAPQPMARSKVTPKVLEPAPLQASTIRPAVPTGIREYFLQNNLTLTEAAAAAKRALPVDAKSMKLLYRPVLMAQAKLRFLERKYNLDHERTQTCLVANADRRGIVQWDDFRSDAVQSRDMDQAPAPQASFASMDAPLSDIKVMKNLERDFMDWIYRTNQLVLRANEELKIYADPTVSQEEFDRSCREAAGKARGIESVKVSASFDTKIKSLREKLQKEGAELQSDKSEYEQRQREELVKGAETLLGILGGRRRSISTPISTHRQTQRSKAEVEESIQTIESLKNQIDELERSKAKALQEIDERWSQAGKNVTEIRITPLRKDVYLELFGVAWFPYHLVQIGEETSELPAFGHGT